MVVCRDVRRSQVGIIEVVVDEGVDACEHGLLAGLGRKVVVGSEVLGQAGARQVERHRA
ncbi:hypothetical protein ACFV2X_53425 [Streptomyces sp. NPDC059679]|uniref:hypothetical protein n=1 Tax=Streptomyces sp. NPDC059679 TaxID=3346903 RepID=UPI0036924DCD